MFSHQRSPQVVGVEGCPQLARMVMGVTEHHGFFCSLILSFMTRVFHPHGFEMVAHTLGRKKREEERRESASIRKIGAFLRKPPWTFAYVFWARTGSYDY